MVFCSQEFLIGFITLAIIYFFCNQTLRKFLLVIANTIFYWYLGGNAYFYLLAVIILSYLIARYKKYDLKYLMIILIILCLGISKYASGFINSHNIIIPIGISFFSFKIIGYLFDVKNNKYEAIDSFIDYYIFASFFASISAGPIESCNDFIKEINNLNRKLSYEELKSGFLLFVFGLFEKIIIVSKFAIIANEVIDNIDNYTGIYVVIGILAYSFQIYTDFDAYSNIAIGLAKMLGINICRNFNVPYLSRNLSEFWRRWHISLSSWFRDYVYIPLGGNRKHQYLNILIVFILSGIWHGNTLNFVLWGSLHGLGQIINRIYHNYISKKLNIRNKLIKIITNIISIAITFVTVCLLWVFFRCNDFNQSMLVFHNLINFNGYTIDHNLMGLNNYQWYSTLLLLIIIIVSDIFRYFTKGIESFNRLPFYIRWFVYFSVIVLTILLYQYSGEYDISSFIYSNF